MFCDKIKVSSASSNTSSKHHSGPTRQLTGSYGTVASGTTNTMSDASDLDDRPPLLEEPQEVADRPLTTDAQLPRPPKPSKKASVSELRTTLAMLGMDSRGKRETLYK